MDSLLTNYLSIGDLIVVHTCGRVKEIELEKTEEYLGLTITDNAIGKAFVKKISTNKRQLQKIINPGDHIAAINSESTVGLRHYQVAKTLKDIPRGTKFTLDLVEPYECQKYMNTIETRLTDMESKFDSDRIDMSLISFAEQSYNTHQSNTQTVHTGERGFNGISSGNNYLDSAQNDDLSISSLPIHRLLSKSGNMYSQNQNESDTENNNQNTYRKIIDKINGDLESFLGINDSTLAVQIYRLAKEAKDFTEFQELIRNSDINVFNFNEDTVGCLWRNVIETHD